MWWGLLEINMAGQLILKPSHSSTKELVSEKGSVRFFRFEGVVSNLHKNNQILPSMLQNVSNPLIIKFLDII